VQVGREAISIVTLSRSLAVLAAIAAAIALAPVLSTLIASWSAGLAGCHLDASGPHSCLLLGMEMKDALYHMSRAYWLFLFTVFYIPVAILLAIAAFVAGRRAKHIGSNPTTVGVRFWLFGLGLLILPLLTNVGLGLLVVASVHWGVARFRSRRASEP
jgi:hypothetical protein